MIDFWRNLQFFEQRPTCDLPGGGIQEVFQDDSPIMVLI